MTAAISGIRGDGGTPLGRYMKVGADVLLEARKADPYGVSRLMIVTDGESADPRVVTENMDLILARGIVVNTIGLDLSKDHQLAYKSHSYVNAKNPEVLVKSMKEALSSEITAADADSAEMFDAISFLPDDSVGHILTSLTKIQNQPLGEDPPVMVVEIEQVQGDNVTLVAEVAEDDSGSPLFFLLGLFVVVGVICMMFFRNLS